MIDQVIPPHRCETEPVGGDRLFTQLPPFQIGKPFFSRRREQAFVVKTRCFPVQFQNAGAHPVSAVIPCFIRDLHVIPPCQKTNGFHIIQIFDLHNEGDYIAAGSAAEAIERLGIRVNHHGRGLFRMERAKALLIPPGAGDRTIAGNNVLNIGRLAQLHYKTARNRHNPPPFSYHTPNNYRMLQQCGTNSSSNNSVAYPSVMPAM